MRLRITDNIGRIFVGEELYVYYYPKAIEGNNGTVERFEERPQRAGVMINGVHNVFTVPRKVERLK